MPPWTLHCKSSVLSTEITPNLATSTQPFEVEDFRLRGCNTKKVDNVYVDEKAFLVSVPIVRTLIQVTTALVNNHCSGRICGHIGYQIQRRGTCSFILFRSASRHDIETEFAPKHWENPRQVWSSDYRSSLHLGQVGCRPVSTDSEAQEGRQYASISPA